MDSMVKDEAVEAGEPLGAAPGPAARPVVPADVIELSSSSGSDSEDEGAEGVSGKRYRDLVGGPSKRLKAEAATLPLGFLDPLPPAQPPPLPELIAVARPMAVAVQGSKQFWKAGDYDGSPVADPTPLPRGMDHLRVHPKFLHSNATSHKWALGAFAELLDNSLDEVCYGATYVNVDMLVNKKDGTRMLLIEDNGGGMDPDKMRQCMSLGYSAKNKIAKTIGQYGNGFKTSTMRLGADVIVFSRSQGKEGKSPTQSIGMLSYTFLKNTGKEDIVVPMLDYEKGGPIWNKMSRSSSIDWNANLETIKQWSPYASEADLLEQFSSMTNQGTRIVIYSLWEDDQGELELDFDADKYDIQIRGVNRDEKKIQMAMQFPNSRHFLTYRHSLRSYASILYLRLPSFFRIVLRGKEIEHHNIVNDMMFKQEVTYRPQPGADGVSKDQNMVAVVTIGFVKDAKDHIDIQGFNVYHKNRLIKPFWRVWNASGSDGRGVIGVLEANFVEPAHDKQGFERTTVLSRLETRLVQVQKTYWSTKCHKIGYAPRRKKLFESEDRGSSPETSQPSFQRSRKDASPSSVSPVSRSRYSSKILYTDKSSSDSNRKTRKEGDSLIGPVKSGDYKGGHSSVSRDAKTKSGKKFDRNIRSTQSKSHGISDSSDESDAEIEYTPTVRLMNESGASKASVAQKSFQKESSLPSLSKSISSVNNGTEENLFLNGSIGIDRTTTRLHSKVCEVTCNGNGSILPDSELSVKKLKDENEALKDRIMKMESSMLLEIQHERDKNKSLTEQLQEAQEKLEAANKEQEALIDIFSEERNRRDREEENLRKKLKDASATIQELLEKLSLSRNNQRV